MVRILMANAKSREIKGTEPTAAQAWPNRIRAQAYLTRWDCGQSIHHSTVRSLSLSREDGASNLCSFMTTLNKLGSLLKENLCPTRIH